LQALAASAAVLHLEERAPSALRNILLIGDLVHWADDGTLLTQRYERLKEATRACSAGVEWAATIDMRMIRSQEALRSELGSGVEVAEVLCVRDWGLHTDLLALEAFPSARRIVYGDGLGVIDVNRDPEKPRFDLALSAIPQPTTADVLKGMELMIVSRAVFLRALDAALSQNTSIKHADEQLAEFAEHGVLVLLGALSEEGLGTTLRGETQMAYRLVKRSASEHCPIVIKPHPRASMGQAGALARLLRRAGHPVRIMGAEGYGNYPIELFERLARAVGTIENVYSSAGLSLRYLYGIRSSVGASQPLAFLTLAPYHVDDYLAKSLYYTCALARLETWDGCSPLPPPPAPKSSRWARFGRLRWRMRSVPTAEIPRRAAVWQKQRVPRPLRRRLGAAGTEGLSVIPDRAIGISWVVARSQRKAVALNPVPVDSEEGVRDRILATLDHLASAQPDQVVGLHAAVLPSSHAPAWRIPLLNRRGIPVAAEATLTAEELEELLEAKADVLVRIPEPAGWDRGLGEVLSDVPGLRQKAHDGHVSFLLRPSSRRV